MINQVPPRSSKLLLVITILQFSVPIAAIIIYEKSNNLDKCDANIESWIIATIILLFGFPILMLSRWYRDIGRKFYIFLYILWFIATVCLWIIALWMYTEINKAHCEKVAPHLYDFLYIFVYFIALAISGMIYISIFVLVL